MASDTAIEVQAAGRSVTVSSPDKVFFEERGETKLDLVRYYLAVEPALMRALGGRPVLMERYPNGAGGSSFFQKRIPKNPPDWLESTEVQTVNGTPSQALVIGDIAHVVWAVNLGCLALHVWPFKAADAEHADELRIDLDPSPGVSFDMVREGAARTRELLAELGLTGYPKTTGRNGIHIYLRLLPRYDSIVVRECAVALARELERRHPDSMTWQWWKEERGRRVFVDYNQNAPHKTVLGAWSARPKKEATVSTPFAWHELETISQADWTIATVPERLAERGDPWESADELQDLEPLLELHRRDMAAGMMDAPWPPVYPKMPNEPPRVAPSRAKQQ